ncbi:hypothetical protein BDR05DRAFT_896902, partial [Suillus weaverae]
LELCHLGHQDRPRALDKLAQGIEACFDQCGTIGDLAGSIQHACEAVSLYPESHPERDHYLNNLAYSLQSRFGHQGKSNDFNQALYEEALGHISHWET